jgi:phosphoglycolate phosphatase
MNSSKQSNKIDTVIFDFDGVIADSAEIFAETLLEVIGRDETFSLEEIKDLRSSTTKEVIRKLGIKKWQVPGVVIRGRRGMTEKIDRVDVFKDIPEALSSLAEHGYKLYILSSGSKESIEGLLNRYELLKTITSIHTGTSLFGKAKKLGKLLKQEHLSLGQCVYVGDETRDIEAANHIGMKSVAVEWGYSAADALKSCEPNAMVKEPLKLTEAINKL